MPETLNFPPYDFRIRRSGETADIFDVVRKKFVRLTPEEWVRQHLLCFLTVEKKVPASLVRIEMHLRYNRLRKRGDIVVFGTNGRPLLLAECKAPSVHISQDAFDQAARYNMDLQVDYLAVTNGLQHYYCNMNYAKRTYAFIPELPDYSVMDARGGQASQGTRAG